MRCKKYQDKANLVEIVLKFVFIKGLLFIETALRDGWEKVYLQVLKNKQEDLICLKTNIQMTH